MCQHQCECGKLWSHQDFPLVYPNGMTQHEPCPFPKIYGPSNRLISDHTQLCPHCYEEKRRYTKNGVEKISIKDAIKRMDEKYNKEQLTAQEIVEVQMDEEARFKLRVQSLRNGEITMEQFELGSEEHYNNLLHLAAKFRTRALAYRKNKVEFDIEQATSSTAEEREAFEAAKRKRAEQARAPKTNGENTAAARKSKEQKMVESFAEKIMAGNPTITREEAIKRATAMFG